MHAGSVTADDASKRSDPAVDLVMGKLKQLALLGTAGPSTIEVFWPEGDAGGNWWPAKVLKVST